MNTEKTINAQILDKLLEVYLKYNSTKELAIILVKILPKSMVNRIISKLFRSLGKDKVD